MLLLGDNGALDKFRSKSSVVVGTDFKVQTATSAIQLLPPHSASQAWITLL